MGNLRERIAAKKAEIEALKIEELKLLEEEEFIKNPPPPLRPLYMLRVIKSVCIDEEILIRADGVNITEGGGDIAFINIDESSGNEEVILSMAKGNWKYFYRVINHFPIGVERWHGVVCNDDSEVKAEKPVPVAQAVENNIPVDITSKNSECVVRESGKCPLNRINLSVESDTDTKSANEDIVSNE